MIMISSLYINYLSLSVNILKYSIFFYKFVHTQILHHIGKKILNIWVLGLSDVRGWHQQCWLKRKKAESGKAFPYTKPDLSQTESLVSFHRSLSLSLYFFFVNATQIQLLCFLHEPHIHIHHAAVKSPAPHFHLLSCYIVLHILTFF